MLDKSLLEPLATLSGDFGIVFEQGQSRVCLNADKPLVAASVIKLWVMLAAFQAFRDGKLRPDDEYVLSARDKVPSCGALTYLSDGLRLKLTDLVTLMIILSDNTATNVLIDRLGIGYINEVARKYGFDGVSLSRKLFDEEADQRGINNFVSPAATALFMRGLLSGDLVSPSASRKMLRILSDQRLNGKMPFRLHCLGIRCAHKTGEDDGISHDVGIIYTPEPTIAVFMCNNADVPGFERFIQDCSFKLTI
ncbi:MAG: class A beta-lactamase-related serine hydrolase [Clostridiales bacterium]|nr:class A beta-lactamase-related serine hydrolase [Clostridiales bacterium]